MKSILFGALMVVILLLNLFFCFWVGNIFIDSGEWFVVPGVVTLFVWFFAVGLCFAVIIDKKIGD